MHRIAHTPYTNDATGWRELAQHAPSMSLSELCAICRWNDRNGAWSTEAMRADGLTYDESVAACCAAIAAWADDI